MKGYIFTSLVAGWRGCPVTMDCAPYSAAPAPSTLSKLSLSASANLLNFQIRTGLVFTYDSMNTSAFLRGEIL
jgi:hypothetical protein